MTAHAGRFRPPGFSINRRLLTLGGNQAVRPASLPPRGAGGLSLGLPSPLPLCGPPSQAALFRRGVVGGVPGLVVSVPRLNVRSSAASVPPVVRSSLRPLFGGGWLRPPLGDGGRAGDERRGTGEGTNLSCRIDLSYVFPHALLILI